uniref:WD repeat-containing protein 79 n=1 Tax=Ascaris suum TaxID=6253 RepID=F1L2E0_ASCSU
MWEVNDGQEATTSRYANSTVNEEAASSIKQENEMTTLQDVEASQRMAMVNDVLEEVLCTVERDYVDDESCTRANSVPESAQSVRFNEVRNERLREERRRDKALRKGTAFFLQRLRASEQVNEATEKSGRLSFDRKREELGASCEATTPVGGLAGQQHQAGQDGDSTAQKVENVKEESMKCVVEEIEKKRAKFEMNFANLALLQRESDAFVAKAESFGFSIDGAYNNYVKCCKWNANGTHLLTSSQDRKVRLFELNEAQNQIALRKSIPLGDLIYDVCWHPSNNCFATSSKDHPIHIWDAEGNRMHSFRGINHLDELRSAYSMCFSLDGRFLYGGYERAIRIFDMASSGRQVKEIPTWKKKIGGQKGIISCIAMNPTMSGVYATSCYGKTLVLYSDLTGSAICSLETRSPGTTHIRYSSDGNFLFAAARKDDEITCWDLRFLGQVLGTLTRPSMTNQRIYFEIDRTDRYLFSGSSSGEVHVFDLSSMKGERMDAFYRTKAHRSAVAGVSLHPAESLIATSSGQRVFPMPRIDIDVSDEENCYEAMNSSNQLDNSLSLWKICGIAG